MILVIELKAYGDGQEAVDSHFEVFSDEWKTNI